MASILEVDVEWGGGGSNDVLNKNKRIITGKETAVRKACKRCLQKENSCYR